MERFDLQDAIKQLLLDIESISNAEDLATNVKTNKLRAKGENLKKDLDFCYSSDNTVKSYLGSVRATIKEMGITHHNLKHALTELEKEFPLLEGEILKYSNRTSSTIEKIIKRHVAEAKVNYEHFKDISSEESKERKYLTLISKLNSVKVYPEPYYHLVLSKEQMDMINNNQIKKRNVRLEYGQVDISKGITEKLCYELLKDNSHMPLALGLGLATGRRFSEIYCTGSFEVVSDRELKFSGQAKKRTTDGDSEPYNIYTLINSEIVINAFNRLRKMDDVILINEAVDKAKSLVVLNKKYSSWASVVAKRELSILNPIPNKWTFSSTRSIWGRMVFTDFFAKDKKWSKSSEDHFWKCMYGHEDPATQLEYKKFKLVTEESLKIRTAFDKLVDAEDDIKSVFEKSIVTTKLLNNAYDKLTNHLIEEPNTAVTRGFLRRTVKAKGLGVTPYVAIEFFEIIEDILKSE